jgi:aminomethyltransferase
VVDDLLVYQRNKEDYLIVINAANRFKDVEWMQKHLVGEVKFVDVSEEMAQLALQGPKSQEILSKVAEEAKLPVKYYSFREEVMVAGISCLVSRTGYTGEDGYELYCKNEDAVKLWNALLKAGNYNVESNSKKENSEEDYMLVPCGLGARDTLRLEASMPLYGHEMDDTVSPIETGLGFAVKLEKEDFIGKAGILSRGEPTRTRVGLVITGRGIAREACPVYYEGELIGATTSGTHCPYLGRPVAMALLEVAHGAIGTQVEVDVRGRRITAEVVALPFYKRAK